MSASAHGLCEFIDASPSPFHVCVTVAQRLRAAGFTELAEADAWPACRRLLHRAGRLAGGVAGRAEPGVPFRIVGAHTDSPNLRVKQHPDRFVVGLAGGRAAALRRGVAELVAGPRPRHQRPAVGALRRRPRAPTGPDRRADPAGAAAGDSSGRGPQVGVAGPAAARQRGVGRGQRSAVVRRTTSPSRPEWTRTTCWAST